MDGGMTLATSEAWAALGWTMLHFLWIGAILGLVAAAGRRASRRASADVQYAHALICLLVLAAAPAVIAARVWGEMPAPAPAPMPDPASGLAAFDVPAGPAGRLDVLPASPPVVPIPPPSPPPSPAPASPLARLVAVLPALWLVGAPITFAALACGLVGAERLRRASRPVGEGALLDQSRRLAAALGVAGEVALATCDRLATPALVGILRPAILLPAAALTGWPPSQLELALLHELIHVRRRDNLVILLQRVIESALFFHPVVWVVSGWVHREREHAVDAAVVRHTGRPLEYAEALLAVASARRPDFPPIAITPMAEGDLVRRIRRLLDTEDHAMKLPKLPLALGAALLLLPAAIALGAAYWRGDGPDDAKGDGARAAAPEQPAPEDTARRVAREALAALEAAGEAPSEDLLRDIAMSQHRLGDSDDARATLRRAADAAAAAKDLAALEGAPETARPVSGRLAGIAIAQAEIGDRDGALETLRRAREVGQERDDPGERLRMLAVIAREYTRLGARDEARAVVPEAARLAEARGGTSALPAVAGVHVAAGDVDGAFHLLDERIRPLPGTPRWAYAEALVAILRSAGPLPPEIAGDAIDRSRRELDGPATAGPEFLSPRLALLGVLAQQGRVAEARRVADALDTGDDRGDGEAPPSPVVTALSIIARALIHDAGRPADARPVLRDAHARARLRDERIGRTDLLNMVGRMCISAGDLDAARAIADDLLPGRRYDLLAGVAAAQLAAGAADAAAEAIRLALADAEIARATPPRPGVDAPWSRNPPLPGEPRRQAEIARAVARLHALAGRFDEAHRLAGAVPDAGIRAAAVADVARLQAAAGAGEAALAWVKTLKDVPLSTLILPALLRGLAERAEAQAKPAAAPAAPKGNEARPADADETRRAARAVGEALGAAPPAGPLAHANLIRAARWQAQIGEGEAARATLRRAAEVAARPAPDAPPGGPPLPEGLRVSTAQALAEVAHAQIGLGDRDAARETLIRARDARGREADPRRRFRTLARIALGFHRLGDRDAARALAAEAPALDGMALAMAGMDERTAAAVLAVQVALQYAAGDVEAPARYFEAVDRDVRDEWARAYFTGAAVGELASIARDYPDRQAARALLEQLTRRIDRPKGTALDDFAWFYLSRAWLALGDFDRALAAARRIDFAPAEGDAPVSDRDARVQGEVNMLTEVAEAQRAAGNAPAALRTLREAGEAARDLPEFLRTGWMDGIFLQMAAAGDPDAAVEYARGRPPGHRYSVLGKVAQAHRKAGRADEAARFEREALADAEAALADPPRIDASGVEPRKATRSDREYRQLTVAHVARLQAELGHFDEARRAIESIEDPALRGAAYDVARLQAAAGQPEAALAWLRGLNVILPSGASPLGAVLEGLADRAADGAKPAADPPSSAPAPAPVPAPVPAPKPA
jgi:beta-lactamase regulating signal transducer with metallopeptidase domain